ncbi:unnamed protein product, partial [Hapterophycus canaliculatus]
RSRIQVSREEQVKALQRIHRAEVYRRERLERFIKTKDDLVDRIKAERIKNSKAVAFERLRWKKEKKAVRKKSESWASLHAVMSSVRSGESSRRTPSRCSITVLKTDGGGSLSSSLTQPTLPSPTPLPLKVRSKHIQSFDEPHQDSKFPGFRDERGPPVSRPRGAWYMNTINHPGYYCRHQEPGQEEESEVHRGTDTAYNITSQTAPASVRCGRITDAETGEPLELKRRQWKFPLKSSRARTVGSIGISRVDAGDSADVKKERIRKTRCHALYEEHVQVDEWQGLWYEREGVDGDTGENKSLSIHIAVGGKGVGDAAEACARATGGGEWKERRENCSGGCGCGYDGDGNNAFVSQCGVCSRRKPLAQAESSSYLGDSNGTDRNRPNASGTQDEPALCSNSEMDSEGNTTLFNVPSPSPRGCRITRPYTTEGGARLAGRTKSCGSSLALPGLHSQPQQGRLEPPTPRAAERPVSPFWMPCPQEPPWFSQRLATSSADRSLDSTQTSSIGGSNGRNDGVMMAGNVGRNAEGSTSQSRDLSGGWSTGSGKREASAESSSATDTAPEGRIRKKMVEAQKIRDRYLSQLQHMVMMENAEEDRRAAALRFAAGHPLRIRRLRLRHEKEREEKRALISWIRRDIELIVVQKMAAFGLIR